jgi:hypothetical protein
VKEAGQREEDWVRPIVRASLVAILASCSGIRPPPFSERNEWGVARGSTSESARRLSEDISSVAPRVVAILPGLSTKPIDARLVKDLHLWGVRPELARDVTGVTIHTPWAEWIEVQEKDGAVEEKRNLAHELVHYWIGPDWDPLPHFLEEGLADSVQDSVVPEGYSSKSLNRVLTLSSALFIGVVFDAQGIPDRCMSSLQELRPGEIGEGALFPSARPDCNVVQEALATPREYLASVRDPQNYSALVCTGYLLVSKIGIERLHRLCLRARSSGRKTIPPDWVLEAAGLTSEVSEAWSRAIIELYGPMEQQERLRRESPQKNQSARNSHVPAGREL